MEDIFAELVDIGVDSKNISIRVLQQKDTWKSFVATISQVRELTIYDSPTWPKDIIVQPFRDTAGSLDKGLSSQMRCEWRPEEDSEYSIFRRHSHTTIFMSPESIITGTPIMTDSRGGITMMRSSQTSMDEAIADTTTRHEKLIWYGYKCYERR